MDAGVCFYAVGTLIRFVCLFLPFLPRSTKFVHSTCRRSWLVAAGTAAVVMVIFGLLWFSQSAWQLVRVQDEMFTNTPALRAAPAGGQSSSTVVTVTQGNDNFYPKGDDTVKTHGKNTFVFFIGLEGVGHHLLHSLWKEMPFYQRLSEETVQSLTGINEHLMKRGLTVTDCSHPQDQMVNTVELVDTLADLLKEANKLAGVDDDQPLMLPINTISKMVSYPTLRKKCWNIDYPDLAKIYTACEEAGVMCSHVYLYRDPYALVHSTTINRGFNKNALQAIKEYQTMYSVATAQMFSFPDRTLGCWNLLQKGNGLNEMIEEEYDETWGSLRDLFAVATDDKELIESALDRVVRMSPVPEDVEAYHHSIVPADQEISMKSMLRAHDQTLAYCRQVVDVNLQRDGA